MPNENLVYSSSQFFGPAKYSAHKRLYLTPIKELRALQKHTKTSDHAL